MKISEYYEEKQVREFENTSGRDNILINGNFDIWQRGTSFASAINRYTADRWWMSGIAGDITRQASGLDNSQYCLRLKGLTASTYVSSTMELKDTVPVRGKILTLSFKARCGSAFAGSFAGSVANNLTSEAPITHAPTVIGNSGDISSSLTTSWQTFTVTSAAVSTSAYTVGMYFSHGASDSDANNYVEIAQIKLEEGSVATDFHPRPIGEELEICKRYFERINVLANNPFASGVCVSTTNARLKMGYTEKRVVPTITFSGTPSDFQVRDYNSSGSCTVTSTIAIGKKATQITMTVASGLTAASGAMAVGANPNGYIDIDAEL